MKRSASGQTILEYVILVTVIIAAVFAAANQVLRPRFKNSLDKSTEAIKTMADQAKDYKYEGFGKRSP